MTMKILLSLNNLLTRTSKRRVYVTQKVSVGEFVFKVPHSMSPPMEQMWKVLRNKSIRKFNIQHNPMVLGVYYT